MKILVIAGPSAVGKTTVTDKIRELSPDFEYIRSATTRAPRGDGRDTEYIYLSREEFSIMASRGELLEYTEYGENLYGTPASEIERIFEAGKSPLLVLDICGVESLKARDNAYGIFAVYLTEKLSVLDERLRLRAVAEGLTEKAINNLERRKAQNREDLSRLSEIAKKFDLIIENKDVVKCAESIISAYRK